MNWALLSLGFGLGTFKFMFAHWMAYGALGVGNLESVIEIFVAVTAGAWFSMSFFFFLSGLLMRKAAEKRAKALEASLKSGKKMKTKKTLISISRETCPLTVIFLSTNLRI